MQKKDNMHIGEYLCNTVCSSADGVDRPPSLMFPVLVGVFSCIAIILVTLIAFSDPYLALIASGFVFFVIIVTANVRFYRKKKFAVMRMAQRAAAGKTTAAHRQASRAMSGGNTSEYLDSTELNLPGSPKPVIEEGNIEEGLRESGPYSEIGDVRPSKNPSKHIYMNYRKEAESDPDKDQLYINPRRSLLPKKSVKVTVSNASTVSDVMTHDDVTTEDGSAHNAGFVKLYDDTTGTK